MICAPFLCNDPGYVVDSHTLELKRTRLLSNVLDELPCVDHGILGLGGSLDAIDELLHLLQEELIARCCALSVGLAAP